MISYKDIKEAQDILVEYWGNDGEKVIEECARTYPCKGAMETFLDDCSLCGSNRDGMVLSGIRAFFSFFAPIFNKYILCFFIIFVTNHFNFFPFPFDVLSISH